MATKPPPRVGPAGRATSSKVETHEYTRQAGKGLTYVIEVDQWGGYRVLLEGRVLRVVGSPMRAITPSGSKKLREEGLQAARLDVEQLRGMPED